MAYADQLDVKEIRSGVFELTFPYNEDFIAFLKMKVSSRDRSYDEDTHAWTVRGEKYISHIESVGMQKFSHVTRIFYRGKDLVLRNVRTGQESFQAALF